MEIGVYKALEQTLALYSNVAIAWVGALVADLVINKPLGLRPPHIEFKRAHLYDINPVGVGAMTIATIVSITAFYGLFGPTAKALSRRSWRLAVAFARRAADRLGDRRQILHRAQAASGAGRTSNRSSAASASTASSPRTWPHCPAYAGPICSLCCSLDARCHDLCKPHARITGTNFGNARQTAAAADLRQDQFAARPLSRRVRGLRRPRRVDARPDLPPDVGRRAGRPAAGFRRAVEGVPFAGTDHRRGRLAVRAGAAEPPRRRSRDAAPDHAADPGNRRAQAHRRRAAARQGSRRIRQPRQEPLCRGVEP